MIIIFITFSLVITFTNPVKLASINNIYINNEQNHVNTNPKPAVLTHSYLMLVNKYHYVEKDYLPKNLLNPKTLGIKTANDDVLVPKEVLDQYSKMVVELELDNLYIFSGFRNFQKQEILYNYYKDDNYSARPGYSEHHTGLALDLSTLDSGLEIFFSRTKEYEILINNCYKYGFILRYPIDKTNETGYSYEPWHFRYVGTIHAKRIYEENLSLEYYLLENFDF